MKETQGTDGVYKKMTNGAKASEEYKFGKEDEIADDATDTESYRGRKRSHKMRDKILGKVHNRTAKVALAGVLRVGGLILCPGDDVAAAALTALNHESHHTQEMAVIPARPFFEKEIFSSDGKKKRYRVGALDDPASFEPEPIDQSKKSQLMYKEEVVIIDNFATCKCVAPVI